MDLPKLSIIVPCFNEEQTIVTFYQETEKALASIQENYIIEYVFIDDGSIDKTLSILKDLSLQDERIHYIQFSRNFGKESAIYAGLENATGDYLVTMDVDLQDPPSLIPEMLEAVIGGDIDCAGSRRVTRAGEPLIRSFFARKFYKIMRNFSEVDIVDGARDFRVMTKLYADAILSVKEKNRFSKGIFPWVGFKTKWFEYENIQRSAGETKWSFGKLFLYSMDGIIAFSSKPLIIASILGFFLAFLSIIMIIFVIVRKLIYDDPVAGWASLVCIILFCSGLQLSAIGILGEYLSKIYIEVKARPLYIIKEKR
ncbi:glycosyltransferase family 2 protein [Pleomorphochaeta sp. DL1XJH-081]|uniref:glycosyltransferase family 2 protein n=1 Tax=Pleomorphochaeta sp. DL1XJH-081 TaxID=3409690 RepID=UPI003BB79B9E